ncbi:hypothetical protein I656_00341 [Geobacillus sp. WSUCF1]|nr:hypothetical protein I656_00341 [Geobacillus sp. WSUCF1]
MPLFHCSPLLFPMLVKGWTKRKKFIRCKFMGLANYKGESMPTCNFPEKAVEYTKQTLQKGMTHNGK